MGAKLTRMQIQTRINDVISMGRVRKKKHSEIVSDFANSVHTELNRKYKNDRFAYTVSDRAYAQGYFDALLNQLWREVEFCYRGEDGILFSTDKETSHRSTEEFYKSNRGHELGSMERAHVWRGTNKPFTDWTSNK